MNAPTKSISATIRAHDEQMLDNEPSFDQLEKQLVASQFKIIKEKVTAASKRPNHDPQGSISPWVADEIIETCDVSVRALTGEWPTGCRPSEVRLLGAKAAWEGRSAAWCPYDERAEDGKIWMHGFLDVRKRMGRDV